jgi:hypothetical protein
VSEEAEKGGNIGCEGQESGRGNTHGAKFGCVEGHLYISLHPLNLIYYSLKSMISPFIFYLFCEFYPFMY